ncbi:MAG: CDGSH iron-sulfur domain-containing protein [Cyanobacteria bacterium]|nr:CDGSH iron-sulfur domain-containing protein [Cyanobacteriota bacterium]
MNLKNPNLPNSPVFEALEAGSKVAYCTCGWSSKGVFCDGSHSSKATGMAPQIVDIPTSKNYAMCACRKSGKGAFCDGAHSWA